MVASSKSRNTSYGVGDEVSYAFGSGIAYGEVVRLLEGGAAVEILLKTGGAKSKNRRQGVAAPPPRFGRKRGWKRDVQTAISCATMRSARSFAATRRNAGNEDKRSGMEDRAARFGCYSRSSILDH